MAAGRPVVATNVGGSPEIVVDGETGYLVPLHDIEAMADRLVSLVANPELAGRMGEAGRARVQSLFGAEQYVTGIESVFAEFSKGQGLRSPVPGNQVAQTVIKAMGPEESQRVGLAFLGQSDSLGRYLMQLFPSVSETHRREMEELSKIVHQQQESIRQYEAYHAALLNSFSWRVTWPLRKISSLLKH
jgi:hypothetical protein